MEELALLANETSVTLSNLKYSTRYKFYLNAQTVRGAGPAISQEAITVMDEGKSANADGPNVVYFSYSRHILVLIMNICHISSYLLLIVIFTSIGN